MAAVTVLGLSGIPRFPAFKEFDQIQGNTSSFAAWALILLIADASLFLMNARGDYLDFKHGVLPITLSFSVLAVAFPCVWALCDGAKLASPSEIDWTYTAKCIFVGEGGLAMVLVFSGLWKPTSTDTLEVLECWRSVRTPLSRLFRGNPRQEMTKEDAGSLRERLKSLEDRSKKLRMKPLIVADLDLANELSTSAGTIINRLEIPEALLHTLRSSDDPALRHAVAFVLKEKDED